MVLSRRFYNISSGRSNGLERRGALDAETLKVSLAMYIFSFCRGVAKGTSHGSLGGHHRVGVELQVALNPSSVCGIICQMHLSMVICYL